MPDRGLDHKSAEASLAADLTDARLVARMRLVLSLAVLLAILVEPWGLPGMDPSRWPIFVAYGLFSFSVDVAAQRNLAWTRHRLLHWADVAWYAAMVVLTGGVSSVVFLFFFFAILTASFRWGQPEGARLTLTSGLAFAGATLLAQAPPDLTRLLLRTSFLLGLGYLCVYWGQAQVKLKERLALLRDVSQLSNPRFGVDHTLRNVMERTRVFFGASSCVLVLRDGDTGQAWMRSVRAGDSTSGVQAEPVGDEVAAELLPFDAPRLVVHHGERHPLLGASGTYTYVPGIARWVPSDEDEADQLAALMECSGFISVPVALRRGQGRLYVCRGSKAMGRDDVVFLSQVVAQSFPVIDHIDLLDRMASEAALRERQKFALDLHDTAIQPYIGLKLALGALRQKASADNPLAADLEKLEGMASRVTDDLRRYAKQVKQRRGGEPAFIAELKRQAIQVRDFYGVDIDVQVDGDLPVNDRLSAEVLQVVREGLSNICKHTLAQRGQVKLQCRSGWLGISIANDSGDTALADFTPKSITERATALGGRAHVQRDAGGQTAIHIHIPV